MKGIKALENNIIKLPPELTIAQADEYRKALFDIIDDNNNLVLDDSDLKRIDTIGLQLLLATITYISAQNKVLSWCSQSPSIRESIKQLGLNEAIFTQYLDA